MLVSLNDLRRYSLEAADGSLGTIRDVYFEDATWRVRYLVANSAWWLSGRELLLSVAMLGGIDAEQETIAVAVTRGQIRHAPSSRAELPVAEQLNSGDDPPFLSSPPSVAVPAVLPRHGASPGSARGFSPGSAVGWGRAHAHLRSAMEMEGYRVAATDGPVGKLHDLIIDRETWRLRYLSAETSSWLTERQVVLSVDWLRRIDWVDRSLTVPVTRKRIEKSPPLDHLDGLQRPYEQRLYESYGYPEYWA